MTTCHRAATTLGFLAALYLATGHPEHSELVYVRLLTHIVLHEGTGAEWSCAS